MQYAPAPTAMVSRAACLAYKSVPGPHYRGYAVCPTAMVSRAAWLINPSLDIALKRFIAQFGICDYMFL